MTCGTGTTFTYDNASRTTSVSNPGASGSESTDYTYDAAGRKLTVTFANGDVETDSYDSSTKDLTSIVHTTSGSPGTTITSHAYTYNSDGRKTSETTADGSVVSYTYDDAGQLTAESKVDSGSTTLYILTYTYDNAGNRASKYDGSSTESYTYDDANKLTSAGVKSYTYDDAGNTTSVYNSVSGITTSLTWDAEERMTGIANDATTSAISDTYTYNGLDQRVGKGGSGGGQIFTRADDAIDAPVLQDWMATYNYGAGNKLVSEVHDLSPTPQSRFYKSDAQGTTRAVRDDTGTLRDVLDCDAFGNALSSTMGNTQPPFGFAGKSGYQTDADTGLMLLGHRYYDSSTGRFLSRDPVLDRYNWYVYCDNDPVNNSDSTGLKPPKKKEDPAPWKKEYPTVDQAGKAVLMYIYPKSRREQFEYGGEIIKLEDGKYQPTEPVTSERRYTVHLDARPDSVAEYHTHPEPWEPDPYWGGMEPSPPDKTRAETLHLPMYIGFTDATTVWEPDPSNPGKWHERPVK